MLEVTNLYFDYSDRPLLRKVQFQLAPSVLLHLHGHNGAGKTTLLKLIAGLLQPTQGDIRYQGRLIAKDLDAYHKQISYVGHKTGVSQLLTVSEQCKLQYQPDGVLQSYDTLLQQFGLQGLAHVSCALLSVGQRRRVGLLRLFMSNASLWLLDEPLVGLDKASIECLVNCFERHLDRGGHIVISSHQTIPIKRQYCQDYRL